MNQERKFQERRMIILQHQSGNSTKLIQEQLGDIDVSYSTSSINRIIYLHRKGESLQLRYSGNSNALKRNDEFSALVQEAISENQNLSIREITNNEDINILGLSRDTIHKELKGQGLHSFLFGQKLSQTSETQQKRLDYYKTHLRQNSRWKDVHFTDECMFDTESLGSTYAWAISKKQVDYSQAPTKTRFPKNIIYVWAMISYEGGEALQLIEGNLNSDQSIEIYEENLSKTFAEDDQILQFDNARCHISNQQILNIPYLQP